MSAFEADRFNHSRTSPEKNSSLRLSRLTPASEECLQHFGAAAGQNPAANLNPVIHMRMTEKLHDRIHGPGFRIVGTIHQAPDTGMNHGAGTHRARLNCNKQVAVSQSMVTDSGTRLAQRDNLGMSGGVRVGDVAVPPAGYDLFAANHDRSHGDFPGFERTLGAAQGLFHPEFVGVGEGDLFVWRGSSRSARGHGVRLR